MIRGFSTGIELYSGETRIEDNHIVSNQSSGIAVSSGFANNVITRNVISANGVGVNSAGHTSEITMNFIGTDVIGTLAMGNSGAGVSIYSGTGNLIEGNVISANGGIGLLLDAGSWKNVVTDNVIGTDVSAVSPLGNRQGGVKITGIAGSGLLAISSANRVLDNVISANVSFGVAIVGPAGRNVVARNRIGTDGTGSLPLPNLGHGVQIQNFANKNQIGCLACSGLDVIAFNVGDGVYVESGVSNRITVKSIFENTELGIDLGPGGITPAEKCDADKGANNLQNHPTLVSATASQSAATLTVKMSLLLANKATPSEFSNAIPVTVLR